MLTFQTEAWPDVVEEMKPIFAEHWQQIATDRNIIPMAMDWDLYASDHEAGRLHVLTVRADGVLVGYYVSVLATHRHYRTTGFDFNDLYYVLPQHRGIAGVRLFIEAEKAMRELGVVTKMTAATKVSHDNSVIFEALGWKLQEKVYAKVLD